MPVVVFLILLILILILASLGFYMSLQAFYWLVTGVPFVNSRKKIIDFLVKEIKIEPGKVLYDLGCGDGKVVLYASKNCGATAIGLEIAIVLYIFCLIQKLLTGNKNAHFKFKNLFTEDMSKADVVYFFGLPRTIRNKMKGKLEKELKPGATVISYAFPVEGWTPSVVDKPNDKEITIYSYLK